MTHGNTMAKIGMEVLLMKALNPQIVHTVRKSNIEISDKLSTQEDVERVRKNLQTKSVKADGVNKHGTKTYRERNKRKCWKWEFEAGTGITFVTVI